MEIERKFLIDSIESLPFSPEAYPSREIEQGYLCTAPVVRIRRDNDSYFLTYKSKGLMAREEYNLPLTKESYLHLRDKTDGRLIRKTRYVIPLDALETPPHTSAPCCTEGALSDSAASGCGLKLELDVFHGELAPLILAEIEFPDEETANTYAAPAWLGKDVTFSTEYHNSTLSMKK